MADVPRSGVRRRAKPRLPLSEAVVVVPTPRPGQAGYAERSMWVESEPSPAAEIPGESSARSPGSPVVWGVPERILAACAMYASWAELFRRRGLSKGEADALILEKAEAGGGVAQPDETINLTLWSQRMRIPRPILEALVLLGVREQELGSPSRPPPFAPMLADEIDVVSSGSGPWTPPPRATRSPEPRPPSSRHL